MGEFKEKTQSESEFFRVLKMLGNVCHLLFFKNCWKKLLELVKQLLRLVVVLLLKPK